MRPWEEQLAELPRYLAEHVQLTLVALIIGMAISLPLGIWATRKPRVETIVLGGASVLQTIPGLALLALMVPLLGALGVMLEEGGWPAPPSIGFLPAVMALSLYSILPMLRNTVTGITGVDRSLVEAARGVGMSPLEVLWQVELPLAMPTLVAGIRTATVWVVGTATLATPVGGTSLGNPIFAGLQTRNLSAVLLGSLAAAALALTLDGLVRLAETGFARRSHARVGASVAALSVIAIASIWTAADGMTGGAEDAREVVIGSKSFTEQYILAEVLAGVVTENNLGEKSVRVRRVPSLGSSVAFDALASGDLDLSIDYSGTIWSTILGRDTVGLDRSEVLKEVERRLRDEYGVILLASLGFENTYCLAVRTEEASRRGWTSISDLVGDAPGLEILGDFEFFERPEWRALEDGYAFAFRRERAMDSSLMYEALRSGDGDVISAYSTDGRIEAYDLRVLADDRGVIPPYDTMVLASREFVEREPALSDRIRGLAGRIDAATMRRLNARVDLGGESPTAVGRDWVASSQAAEASTPTDPPEGS